MPRVSILLPFHKAGSAAGIRIVLHKIFSQSFDDWELIAVDNANDEGDELVDLFRAASTDDPRIKLVHEPVKGISYALNTGLRHCSGEYIARLDIDDHIRPARLQLQAEYLDAHPHIGLVSGLVTFSSDIDGSKGYEEYVNQVNSWITEEDIYHHRFVESPFAHPSVMFRRELTERYGSYSTGPVPEDYELWLRWMHHGVRMAKIPYDILRWNDHANRLSRTHSNYSPKAFDSVRYHYLARWLAPRLSLLPPVYIWGGKLARKKAKLLEEQGIRISGYIDVKQPDRNDNFIHYIDIPKHGEIFIISMVSNRGKYAEVRDFLLERGYGFERDFVLAG